MPIPDHKDGLSGSFDRVADDVPQILWSVDSDGRHDYVNRKLREFVGERIDAVDAETWTSLVHPDDRERVEQKRRELPAAKEPYEIEYRLWHNSGEYRWLRLTATPKLDENGRVLRWYGTSTDIHLEKTVSLERELVAHELDHRIKNIFTLVNGLVGLSARESPELLPVLNILRKRLEALHNAHQYLRISGTEPSSAASGGLKGLIEAILRPYCGDDGALAARFNGDDVSIDTGEVTSFALLIHELATNSLKYGALAANDGRLSIHISNRGQVLRLRWAETAGSIPAHRPSHSGYGSTLLKLTVEKQLSGQISRRQGRGYLCYVLTLPRLRA
ncbi:PAS domain S-box protein [Pseudaminobacter arsenicus]|uniref:Blue-light-activated histidine kinase n=1 Tax=Borborobacter arsenicus TaxID=1851146 RepID=A0A432V8K6_9HYPH|nr:PAS domain-containing protein [Pseudaminobacter arsenicus]RUM98484.1 PAS domain S-box protein [Pseudaminobacter arsenicus]